MNTKQPSTPGFQNIQEVRLMIRAIGGLRDAAALALKLPPPLPTSPTRRDGAAQGSP